MEKDIKIGFIWLFWVYMSIFIFYSAAANLKKVSLELGGKSPLIIFSDCELDRAVKMVMLIWSKIYSKPLWYILTLLQYSSWLAKKNTGDPLHERPWDLLENRFSYFFIPAKFNCLCCPKKAVLQEIYSRNYNKIKNWAPYCHIVFSSSINQSLSIIIIHLPYQTYCVQSS